MTDNKWQVEYEEAGKCFRLSATFFIEIIKGFAAGNVVLFAALAYLARDGLKSNLSTILVALSGLVASVAAIIIHSRIYKYWTAFLKRAVEIEKLNDLKLYTAASGISATGRVRTVAVLAVVYSVMVFLWLVVLLRALGLTQVSMGL